MHTGGERIGTKKGPLEPEFVAHRLNGRNPTFGGPAASGVRMVNTVSRLAIIAALCAVVAGAATYWLTRSSCVEDRQALVGMERISPNGIRQYFDGRCWTPNPMPPRDNPF